MPIIYGTIWGTTERIAVEVDIKVLRRHGSRPRHIVDLKTGKHYTTQAKSCGIPRCMCETWLRPVKPPYPA
jgi:hypothetical protein